RRDGPISCHARSGLERSSAHVLLRPLVPLFPSNTRSSDLAGSRIAAARNLGCGASPDGVMRAQAVGFASDSSQRSFVTPDSVDPEKTTSRSALASYAPTAPQRPAGRVPLGLSSSHAGAPSRLSAQTSE